MLKEKAQVVYNKELKDLSKEARASLKRAKKSYVIDPKPSDLSMVRMKLE